MVSSSFFNFDRYLYIILVNKLIKLFPWFSKFAAPCARPKNMIDIVAITIVVVWVSILERCLFIFWHLLKFFFLLFIQFFSFLWLSRWSLWLCLCCTFLDILQSKFPWLYQRPFCCQSIPFFCLVLTSFRMYWSIYNMSYDLLVPLRHPFCSSGNSPAFKRVIYFFFYLYS